MSAHFWGHESHILPQKLRNGEESQEIITLTILRKLSYVNSQRTVGRGLLSPLPLSASGHLPPPEGVFPPKGWSITEVYGGSKPPPYGSAFFEPYTWFATEE